MNLSKNSYIAIECLLICDDSMIIIILYTVLLLFIDRNAVSSQCLNALEQWYQHMIPALFPMMLFSSVLVDTGFAEKIGNILSATVLRPFQISRGGSYCLMSGFLFGFPMGAKTTADMYSKGQISKQEAEYLLSFVNCIGPMYTLYVIHNLFPTHALMSLLLGIYALPLLYGICVRYTIYKGITFTQDNLVQEEKNDILDALYDSVPKSSKAMVHLGGYMILFQVSFVTVRHLLSSLNISTRLFYPLLEITGGFYLIPKTTHLCWILFFTTWGGLSCFLQSYNFIKPVGLNMKSYFLHKTILATLAFVVGLFWESLL